MICETNLAVLPAVRNINGSTNQIYYIPLFTKGGSGSFTPSDKTFFGDIYIGYPEPTFIGWLGVVINGVSEQLPIYQGVAGTNCCTCINGNFDDINSYKLTGYAYIDCDGIYKWIELYNLATESSTSSSSSKSSVSSMSSGSSESSESSSSSSSFEDVLYVYKFPGSFFPMSPNASGAYNSAGTYNGYRAWNRTDGAYWIWHHATYEWIISVSLGDNTNCWVHIGDDIISNYYFNEGSFTGQLMVVNNPMSSSSSNSSSSSSSKSSESSSSSSSMNNHVFVTGSLTPNATGTYMSNGIYNGKKNYTNGTYFIWWNNVAWEITDLLGGAILYEWYKDSGSWSILLGIYHPASPGTHGDATVTS